MRSNNHLEQWDRDYFIHPSTHLGQFARGEIPHRVIKGGDGVYITDMDENKLLDAFAGLYCVNVGYGRREIIDAVKDQVEELAYYHAYVGHGSTASIELSKMIIDRSPPNMSRVYFGLSGSDANETNIKLTWYYNNIMPFYLSESIGRIDRSFSPQLSGQEIKKKLNKVSPAELKVLTLLTRSLTSRQIADELNISVRTVQAHRVSLAEKLDAKGPNKLLELAIRNRDNIVGILD